ncbi:unnamed protein product, partial [Bubo scandiacus]
ELPPSPSPRGTRAPSWLFPPCSLCLLRVAAAPGAMELHPPPHPHLRPLEPPSWGHHWWFGTQHVPATCWTPGEGCAGEELHGHFLAAA